MHYGNDWTDPGKSFYQIRCLLIESIKGGTEKTTRYSEDGTKVQAKCSPTADAGAARLL